MVLTTECIVADMPEKKEAAPAAGAWVAATSTTDRQLATLAMVRPVQTGLFHARLAMDAC